MSIAFYMDEHVPFAITAGLVLRGVDVLTSQADGARGKEDIEVLDRATELGRTVFTQDEDFLAEARRRQRTGNAFAGVVYAHQLNVTIGQCVSDLELISKVYEPQDLANRVEYLPV
jgi:predicted nuclease of predicted toxin-antitoxin system